MRIAPDDVTPGEWLTGWRVFSQIADRLRERIATGAYPAGTTLPSESELCREFHVARNTVRRALSALEEEGLIVTVPSKGRTVLGGEPSPSDPYRHQVIARDLREQITQGELAPGDALPSENVLKRRYGASRNTVRAALDTLEREGLVLVQQGKGRFVRRA